MNLDRNCNNEFITRYAALIDARNLFVSREKDHNPRAIKNDIVNHDVGSAKEISVAILFALIVVLDERSRLKGFIKLGTIFNTSEKKPFHIYFRQRTDKTFFSYILQNCTERGILRGMQQ